MTVAILISFSLGVYGSIVRGEAAGREVFEEVIRD
jgi:hypothetical protein